MNGAAEPPFGVVRKDAYSPTSRMIDIAGFLVLAGALFLPIARFGFRTIQLVDTDAALVVSGAALIGLLAAIAAYRRITVASAIIYGAVFALFIGSYYERMGEVSGKLKDNPFGDLVSGLVAGTVGLEWGCGVITLALLGILCSGVISHQVRQP